MLGYHAFATRGERPSRYVVPERRFARQLWWLARAGYNVVTFGEYLELRAGYRLPPPKTVVLTIDDGYVDTATVAGPTLRRFGFRATVFVITAPSEGRRAEVVAALADRPMLGADEAGLLPRDTARSRPSLGALDRSLDQRDYREGAGHSAQSRRLVAQRHLCQGSRPADGLGPAFLCVMFAARAK